MIRLFYISTASPFFRSDNLEDICLASAKNNKEIGVGGALVFNGSNFGQILEGDEEVVRQLYERIKIDPRHNGANIMSEKPVSERFYADWGMNFTHGFDFSSLEQAMQS